MLTFNKDQLLRLKSILKSDTGKLVVKDLKEIIVRDDNYPANASDGLLFAMLQGRREGELSVLKQLIKIGESND